MRVRKILDLIFGSDGCTRGASVQVRSNGGKCTKLMRPAQRVYPLEIQCEVPVQQTNEASSSRNPDPVSTEVRTEQPVSTRSCPKRATAVEVTEGRKAGGSELISFELFYELSLSLGFSILCKGLLTR